MARGDIFLIDIPYPHGAPGHEQAGKRPAVAVQADRIDPPLTTVIVVPFTAKLSALSQPHTFRVDPSPANGLDQPSVLLVSQLRTVDRRRIVHKLGTLEQHYLHRLDLEMRRLLDL